MDEERIFRAEQIKIAPELAGILKDYSKEVIRRQPQDEKEILRLSYEYFARRVEEKEDCEEKK